MDQGILYIQCHPHRRSQGSSLSRKSIGKGCTQCARYNIKFRGWAAAKGVRRWGELLWSLLVLQVGTEVNQQSVPAKV